MVRTDTDPGTLTNNVIVEMQEMAEESVRKLVSVIIPVINRKRLIVDVLDSVAAKICRSIDVVVGEKRAEVAG